MAVATTDDSAALSVLIDLPPAERAEWLRAAGISLAQLSDEAEKLALANVSRAMTATAMLLELSDQIGAGRARARRARAQALAYAGQATEALEICRAGEHMARAEADEVEAARLQLVSLHPLNELGRFDEAVAVGERARESLLRQGLTQLAARADFNLGGIHQNRDDPQRALECFDRAAPAFAADALITGYLNNNRGEALLLLNDFAGAERAFRSGLESSERASAGVAAAIIEGNLADLAARCGRFDEALLYFERARRRFERDRAESHLVRLLAEQAEALTVIGLADAALGEYRAVLPRLEALKLKPEVARARHAVGRLLLQSGDLNGADQELGCAAEIYRSLGQARQEALVLLDRALLALRAGEPAVAREFYEHASPQLQQRPMDAARLAQHRAMAYRDAGDEPAACRELTHAINALAELRLAPLLAELHAERGAASVTHALPAALDDFRKAIQETERIRGTLRAAPLREAFFGRRSAAYDGLVRGLIDAGAADSLDEAFETIERAKSRELLDSLVGFADSRMSPRSADEATLTLMENARRLAGELNALHSRLDDAGGAAGAVEESAAWQKAVGARERELAEVERRLSSSCDQAGMLTQPLALPAVQSRIEADQMLIECFIAGDELLALTLRPDSVGVHRRLDTRTALAKRIDALRFQIRRAQRPGALDGRRGALLIDDVRCELESAAELWLAPLAERFAGIQRVVIVAHGPLHLVPWHALRLGNRYWIESHEISYAPSASIWATRFSAPATRIAPGAACFIGAGDELAPQIEIEARDLARRLSADSLLGDRATRAAVCARIASAALAHVSSHARFSRRQPFASGLKLADGWLTLREIASLRIACELVVLSGCATGENTIGAGDELFGLLTTFLSAGARRVIASQWPVSDRSAYDTMSKLYDSLFDGVSSPATALRSAQLSLLSSHAHPFKWAPFFLVG